MDLLSLEQRQIFSGRGLELFRRLRLGRVGLWLDRGKILGSILDWIYLATSWAEDGLLNNKKIK